IRRLVLPWLVDGHRGVDPLVIGIIVVKEAGSHKTDAERHSPIARSGYMHLGGNELVVFYGPRVEEPVALADRRHASSDRPAFLIIVIAFVDNGDFNTLVGGDEHVTGVGRDVAEADCAHPEAYRPI